MSAWLPGVLLLAAGIAWLILRVIIEKKAMTGSFWSHLVKQIAVIRELPFIGFLWKLMPLLLITAGVLWLTGVRPPGMSADKADEKESGDQSTLCGDPEARPDSVDESLWPEYTCTGQEQAGESWTQCLPRRAYTSEAGRGCPGKERCCPPDL